MAKINHFVAITYFAGLLAFAPARRVSEIFGEDLLLDGGGVRIFGPMGPKLTDVAQGELGTCYFLSTIASIAQKHPELIKQMFVKQELWKGPKPVYTTRWLLNGKEVTVAVDGQVPTAEKSYRPFFVKVNDGADFWPVILEKAWAKIFGSFKSVSGGYSEDAFKAITQAPVELFDLDEDDETTVDREKVWMKLKEANEAAANFPVTASVKRPNKYRLPYPHSYSVLEVSDDYNGHGRAVHLNNPWGTKNKYCGSIPNPDHKQGSFWMAFDEFIDAFSKAVIAKVQTNYSLTWETLPTSPQFTTAMLEFEMQEDLPFSVQLEWPSSMFAFDCPVLSPIFSMGIAKEGDFQNAVFAKKGGTYMSNARADLAGNGKYLVFVNLALPSGAWLDEFVVNVYAAEQPTISKSNQDPWDMWLQMMGLCKEINVGTNELFVMGEKRAHGFPVFEAADYMMDHDKVVFYEPEKLTISKTASGLDSSVFEGRGWLGSSDIENAKQGRGYELTDVRCHKPAVSVEVLPIGVESVVALEFEVKHDLPFSVQLEWASPEHPIGSPILSPIFVMGVAKQGDFKNALFAKQKETYASYARADLTGQGHYTIFAMMHLSSTAWFKEAKIKVFAEEPIAMVKSSQDPWDVFFQFTGMCKMFSVAGAGKYGGQDGTFVMSEKRLNGFPIFEPANDKVHPQYKLIFYSADEQTVTRTQKGWSSSGKSGQGWQVGPDFNSAKAGSFYPGALKMVKCVESALLQTHETFDSADLSEVRIVSSPVEAYKTETHLNTSVLQIDMKRAATDVDVEALEFHANCISKLPKLNNWNEIQEGDDLMFPTNLESIAKPGEKCGDSATGSLKSCEKFDHWEDISKINIQLHVEILEQKHAAKCVTGEILDGKCTMKNTCSPYDTPSLVKGLARSYNTNVKGAMPGGSTMKEVSIAYCEVLSDIGGHVVGFTPPDPCT